MHMGYADGTAFYRRSAIHIRDDRVGMYTTSTDTSLYTRSQGADRIPRSNPDSRT